MIKWTRNCFTNVGLCSTEIIESNNWGFPSEIVFLLLLTEAFNHEVPYKNESGKSEFLTGAGHRLCSVFKLNSMSLIFLLGDRRGGRNTEP